MLAARLIAICLLLASSTHALEITVQGQSSAAPDRVVIFFYLKSEIRPDNSADQRLTKSWSDAHQWLLNYGIKDDQITLRDPAPRMFQDQRKYLVRKIAITRALTADKQTEDLAAIADLIDHAAPRGLLPTSQLAAVAQDADVTISPLITDVQNHFVFFLPADPDKLLQQAIVDGEKRLRDESARITAAAKIAALKLHDLHVDNSSIQATELRAGVIGVASPTFSAIHLSIPITAKFDFPAAPAQSLTITGTSRVALPIQRAIIQSRLSANSNSLRTSLDRLAERTHDLQSLIAKIPGAKLDLAGIGFFCGNASAFGINDANEGAIPMGVYRDVRLTLDRSENESESDFHKRIEKLAIDTHPNLPAETIANNDNPYLQLFWGPKDANAPATESLTSAIADATRNAQHALEPLHAKPGGIVEITASSPESIIFNNPYLQPISSSFAAPIDLSTAARLSDHPILTTNVVVKFATTLP